jgi:hypothetical protein
MSDVRLVSVGQLSVPEYLHRDHETITDDDGGTHLLVPVDSWSAAHFPGGVCSLQFDVKTCPTCGGSGYKPGWIDGMADREAVAVKCPDCNGRGWKPREAGMSDRKRWLKAEAEVDELRAKLTAAARLAKAAHDLYEKPGWGKNWEALNEALRAYDAAKEGDDE